MYKVKPTEYWELYKNGVDHHNNTKMYTEDEQCYDFYYGDHWKGAKLGNEKPPVLNFIKPIGKYKVAMIAQNYMDVVFSDMNGNYPEITEMMSKSAATNWEVNKMDSYIWDIIKKAFITGDCYLYSFAELGQGINAKAKLKYRVIDRTNVYFSDEQNPDINSQEWVILSEGRKPVAKLREIAKTNGLKEEDVKKIVADTTDETDLKENSSNEVKTPLGKCTSIIFMRKTSNGVEFCRSTEQVIYEPMQTIKGLDIYPLVGYRWEDLINNARGLSGVKYLIPTQIEVNSISFRRALATKKYAYPIMAYDGQAVTDVSGLDQPNARIKINNLAGNPVKSLIDYISPQSQSPDAAKLQDEYISLTQTLEGAGDAALGQIDPTQASGEAIRAAKDQAAIPLNEQISSYKQLREDIAYMDYKMKVAYSPDGLEVRYEDNGETVSEVIPQEVLQSLDLAIRIDVSPIDPYSKLAQETALERLMTAGNITFEEYVNLLDTSSTVPKLSLSK